MRWYAAHVLVAQRFRDGLEQGTIGVYENVYLVSADSDDEARAKAEVIGLRQASRTDGTDDDETWSGRPTRWVYAGIRKIVACSKGEQRPDDGDEITSSVMVARSEDDLRMLAAGEPVLITYED